MRLEGFNGQLAWHDTHPAADWFPLMDEDELTELRNDMAEHGQRDPIILTHVPDPTDPGEFIDVVLDGRNRYRACMMLGLKPRFEHYLGPDPYDYVISTNLRRRHLNESQRAMIAARAASRPQGGQPKRKRVEPANLRVQDPEPDAKPTARDAPIPAPQPPTQAEAAQMLKVSERSVQHARVVQEQGAPELVAAVDKGHIPVSTAATLVEMPPEKQRDIARMSDDEIRKAAQEINRKRREERRAQRVEKIARIEQANRPLDGSLGKHSVHYWDPPWKYDEGSTDDTRDIANKYPPMELADICALPVQEVCTPDAVMYMWATAPKVEEALQVLKAWGFTYRSQIIWHKTKASAADVTAMMEALLQALESKSLVDAIACAKTLATGVVEALKGVAGKMGMGYWARIEHEILIIGTRGNFPTPPSSLLPRSVIAAPVGEHSAKPALFAEMLERLYPELSKFEGFCRSPRPGWTVFGNQSGEQLAV